MDVWELGIAKVKATVVRVMEEDVQRQNVPLHIAAAKLGLMPSEFEEIYKAATVFRKP